jgi:mono/diheme cytochrome c family protein
MEKTMSKHNWMAIGLALSLFACKGKEEDTGDGGGGDGSTTEETGAALFAKCAGCHGADGGGVTGPNLSERVPNLTDDALRDVLSDGTGDMNAVPLSDAEESVLFDYVRDEFGQYGGA